MKSAAGLILAAALAWGASDSAREENLRPTGLPESGTAPVPAALNAAPNQGPISAAPGSSGNALPGPEKPGPASKVYPSSPSPFLSKELEEYFLRSHVGGRLGVSVYSLHYGRFEAAIHDFDWFTPASCLKLIVTAAALDTFPVNFFPATSMEVYGTPQAGVLRGKVRVSGGGDPNISDRFFPDALRPLDPFVDSLKRMGIDTLRGAVEVADTFFTGPRRPEAWKQHHFNTWYGAEVSALSFNDNCFTLTVLPGERPGAPVRVVVKPDVDYVRIVNKARTVAGGRRRLAVIQDPRSTVITLKGSLGTRAGGRQMILPVRDPTQYFRASLLKAMAARGLVFISDEEAAAVAASAPAASFRFTTAPFTDILEEINQRSQNLHAEMVLRHLGKFVKGEGSSEAGIRAEKDFLARQGLDPLDFQLFDGCGLSPYNRLKPNALASLLARMARHRYGRDYINSLASPGLDGATGRRLRPYMPMNLMRFKTGTISGAQGLCGYVFGIDGDTLAVSLFINDFRSSGEAAGRLLDSLLARTAMWFNKERPAMAEAHRLLGRPGLPQTYMERLDYFSHALEEKPYFLGPTGEGRFGLIEPAPLLDLERFDCVTYIESAMALALSREARQVLPTILSIRYRSDTVGYPTRNHYFVEDWLKHNAARVRVLRYPGDTLEAKPIDKIKFFQAKQLPSPAANPVCEIPYMPYEKALAMLSDWKYGRQFLGVAFVTHILGLDVTHTGFLLADGKNPPLLRQASQLQGKVVTMDFKEYLESRRGKCAGVLFFEFLPPAD